MLVVKFEIWPGGNEEYAREILRANISNISDLADTSDYRYEIRREGRSAKSGTTVRRGTVLRHERADGAITLFWKVLAASCIPWKWR